jgi:hypothetical protein
MDPALPSSAPRTVTRSGVLAVPDVAFLGCSPDVEGGPDLPQGGTVSPWKERARPQYALRSTW